MEFWNVGEVTLVQVSECVFKWSFVSKPFEIIQFRWNFGVVGLTSFCVVQLHFVFY